MRLFKFLSAAKAKGFTLIELLVVIGILGILAAALIATIDPFEQLRKANDTTTRNTSVEFVNAVTRYYGNHGTYPWADSADGGSGCNNIEVPDETVLHDGTGASDCVTALVTEGELKAPFATSKNILTKIFISGGDTVADIPLSVCYKPESKSGKADVNTKFDKNGTENAANCGDDCHYCFQ